MRALARLNYSQFETRRGSLDALVRTGDINLVRSPTLRREIVQYSSELTIADEELVQTNSTLWDNVKDLSRYIERQWEAERDRSMRGRGLEGLGFTGLVGTFELNVLRVDPEVRAAYGAHELALRNRVGIMLRLRGAAARMLGILGEAE